MRYLGLCQGGMVPCICCKTNHQGRSKLLKQKGENLYCSWQSHRTQGTHCDWNIIYHKTRTEQWWWIIMFAKHNVISHLTKVIILNKNVYGLLKKKLKNKQTKPRNDVVFWDKGCIKLATKYPVSPQQWDEKNSLIKIQQSSTQETL